MRFRALLHPVFAATVLLGPSVSRAQDADGLTIRVDECVGLKSEADRYDCYERLVDAARGEREDVPEAAAKGQEPGTPGIGPAATDEGEARPAEPEEFVSTIAALDEKLRDRYTITLDNGQVWRQMLAKRYALRVGQEVRIYPTRWGDSYRLSSKELRGFIQVERVK